MIEIKMSQGAKPGHGGLLPGSKRLPISFHWSCHVLFLPFHNVYIFT